jgi:internalin A
MGTQKFGRYEIKSELGRGGMANVYLAYDPFFDRDVALKVFHKGKTTAEGFHTQFEREIRIIGRLEHPAIVPVYDMSRDTDPPYIVMRLMYGGSLAERLARGPLSLEETSSIMNRIKYGLDEAHAKGVVHRDLKPANILFDAEYQPYISDFGIAKNTLTKTPEIENQPGNFLGTPTYMSPEQVKGEDVDRRSDIYSLGIILFEMLAGVPPFKSNSPWSTLQKHINEPVPNILEINSSLDPRLNAILTKILAKNPSERYASTTEFVLDLNALLPTEKQDSAPPKQENISTGGRIEGRSDVERTIEGPGPWKPKEDRPAVNRDAASSSASEISSQEANIELIGQIRRNYKIVERLGGGDLNEGVYLAQHLELGTHAIIKVLAIDKFVTPHRVSRALQESHILTGLAHPNIGRVLDVLEEKTRLYIFMDYVEGRTLFEIIKEEREQVLQNSLGKNEAFIPSPLSADTISSVIRQISEALDYAHRQGAIHLDIKPSNIFITPGGQAILSDFGIIRIVEILSGADTGSLTGTGILMGTPAYMSPEQARGMGLSGASDVYSLACIAFEMLTGRVPFESDSPLGVLVKKVSEDPPDLLALNPHLSPLLRMVIEKALAKELPDRFATPIEFANALRATLTIQERQEDRLDLSGKGLKAIPEYVWSREELTALDLSHNELEEIPANIGQLRNLRYLNLGYNKLTHLTKSIGNLVHLKGLVLGNNPIRAFPEPVLELKTLLLLDLRSNELISLPEKILELEDLVLVELGGNPLISPPYEIAHQGINAVREFLRQLRTGQASLFEAKLLILGEGGAGKTSLAKKIIDPKCSLDADNESTKGIDVLTWSFKIDDRKFFRVNIWDFGGQEIYHTTHQFFLTKRSLYALVADTRKEDTDFYYWLNVVELLSNNSPLLIINNEKQDRHREISERQLRGQFENLKSILTTNLATNRGLEFVIREIKHYLMNLPHIGAQLPTTWVRVREILESDPHHYMGLNEYLDICWQNGFTEIKDSMQLSEYFHDLGTFLHFQDDPILKNIIILKPKWGTDAAYKVLDNQMVISNLGHFSRADLSDIWIDSIYSNMHDELLQLMMKFHLCYEIPGGKGIYIAPQLLTENQPRYEWDTTNNLMLRYSYEFMPKGILTQLIVRMHNLIREQKYVWKSGLVIEREKTFADVIEYYAKNEIHVRVFGEYKTELLAIVMYELDKIHATYRRLKSNKLIPCNCSKCKFDPNPYFYSYDRLQKFIEDKQENIQCQENYEMVNVRGLIADVLPGVLQREDGESETIMNKFEVHIGAGAKVDGPIVLGGAIENSFIRESFNKATSAEISDQLKETLQLLVQAVDTMSKSLSDELAQEAAGDLDTLVQEAAKKSPRPRWYQLSAEGLSKAAESVGKVGQPVIELAGKVVSLLMVMNK